VGRAPRAKLLPVFRFGGFVGYFEQREADQMSREDKNKERRSLEKRALSVKMRFLEMYKKANAGHIGSSLSCAEILVLLKFAWMSEEDTLLLSKGHAAGALYSLLAEAGQLSSTQIDSFYEEGTQLSALPPVGAFKQIPFATGSLGYGLSICAGMALGARLKGQPSRLFCVTSDGELNEGSLWEAALFIAHRRLSNVIWIVDRNRIQATGRTEDVMGLEPLDAKLKSFGFQVIRASGHDFESLLCARDAGTEALSASGVPLVIIADTFKGNGVSFMHDTVDCHYLPMNDAQYAQAVSELTRAYEALSRESQHAI
jgi:transketolase